MQTQSKNGLLHGTGRERKAQREIRGSGAEFIRLLGALAFVAALVFGAERDSFAASFFETPIGAHDAAAGDQFGFAVSASEDTVIVGSPFDGDAGLASGSVYVFQRNVGGIDNWGELKKLTAADAATGDSFGFAVAISENTAVIGAPFRNVEGSVSGAVYIFERHLGGGDNWGLLKRLVSSDAATGDQFGFAVAISGNTLVVGAPSDDDAGLESGGAYVFERDLGGGGNWGQVTKLTASSAAEQDQFGSAVAISENTVVVGAPSSEGSMGSAYVFERALGGAENWGETKRLSADDAAVDDQFGFSVAISQNTVLIGARLVSGWIETGRPPAPDDPTPDPIRTELEDAGAAYFFERDFGGANTWSQVKKLTVANTQAGDQFGYSVAMRGDRAVVGSLFAGGNRVGSAYIRERNRGGRNEWGQLEKLMASVPGRWDGFGFGVAIGADAVVVGAPETDAECPGDRGCDSGVAYVYTVAQTREQQACINALNRSLLSVWGEHARAFEKCVKNHARTGSSAEACVMSPSSAVERAERRTFRHEATRCADSAPDFGVTDAPTVNDAAMQLETEAIRGILGVDLDGSLVTSASDSDAARCQHAVVKSVDQCQRSTLKEFNRCKKSGLGDALFREAVDLEGCVGEDSRGAVARACDAMSGKLAIRILPKSCLSRGVDLSSAFPGCGEDEPADLAACVEETVACRVCVALNQADDLAVDCDLLDDGRENASCL